MAVRVMDLIFFIYTELLLLMFLKIPVQNFCVSMETCSIGIEEVFLELLKNRMFLNFSRTVHSLTFQEQ